ncbi:MAG: ATP-binding protein [Pseudanabaenaceae cyanobacterium]
MAPSVVIAQISEEQEKLWQAVLESQGLEVTVKSPQEDLTQYLKEEKRSGQKLPDLILMDMGITSSDGSSLQAVEVCRWCSENGVKTKVILNNSKQDQILPLKQRWATRLGAADLLPRLFSENLHAIVERVAEIGEFSVSRAALEQIFATTRAETEDTTVLAPKTEVRTLREVKTDEIVRKLAALTSTINEVYAEEDTTEAEKTTGLSLDATIQELTLYDFQLETNRSGSEAIRYLEENTLIPGVILVENGKYFGFLSRRRILEILSRPFGQELFLKRPIVKMYDAGALDTMILPGNTSVVVAAVNALRRAEALIYEPLVVQIDRDNYRMLDLHDLLLAQLEIQETASKMLRDQAKARIVQMEKMASLGQMLAEVAHDIRNPVNFIHGNVEYLQSYCQSLVKTIETLQREISHPTLQQLIETENLSYVIHDLPRVVNGIKLGAEQLRNLVTGLQSFSHMEEVVPDILDIHECIENSLTILSNRLKDQITVEKHFNEEVGEILGFQGQLMQVFMNIIGNAIDALYEKMEKIGRNGWQPKIIISTGLKQENGNDFLSIKIADNGEGIPPEHQKRIFESFFTTKAAGKGTGLGMAITHEIVVQKHKGKILLNSPYVMDGKKVTGTEFEILLPTS